MHRSLRGISLWYFLSWNCLKRLDEVVVTTAHAADMCIEESDASAPFEASALAILWHSSKTGGSGLSW